MISTSPNSIRDACVTLDEFYAQNPDLEAFDARRHKNIPPIPFHFVDASRVKNKASLYIFIRWDARRGRRKPRRMQNLARLLGIRRETLSRWRRLTGFLDEIQVYRKPIYRLLE